jgi:hypothetical protein
VPASKPPFVEIVRIVAEISRVAEHVGLGRIVLPHPETGEPTLCEFDLDAARDLFADFTDAVFADPNHDWTSTPFGSRAAALEASISEFALALGPPQGFDGEWTKEVARELLPLTIFRMGLYPWFFTYLGEPERDFFRRARELLKQLEIADRRMRPAVR